MRRASSISSFAADHEAGREDHSLPVLQPGQEHSIYGYTLGCRLNSYETEAIVEEFRRRCGLRRTDEQSEASVTVVNSCAVTSRSTARSRKAVRNFRRRGRGVVVVTGCVAEVTPEEFGDEHVLIVPNTDKEDLVRHVAGILGLEYSAPPLEELNDIPGSIFPLEAPEELSRTRAFLKVQDGCDNRCTYCIVPLARGNSRSQPRELVLRQAAKLADSEYREILLTGVDLVRYGRDLYGDEYGLVQLVRELLSIGGFRLRLSSMEPIGLTSGMLRAMALPGLCRHFHIPVQSGSNSILKAMGRNYSAEDIEKLLNEIGELFPGAAVGCDIITGFPGETEGDFKETLRLMEHSAVSYLHVFPYSQRPGTPAASMEQLHPETVTERARYLRDFSEGRREAFRRSQIGNLVSILVESRSLENDSRLIGVSDNYIPVLSPADSREGDLITVELTGDSICWDRR